MKEKRLTKNADLSELKGRRVRLPRDIETADGSCFPRGSVLVIGGAGGLGTVALNDDEGNQVLRTGRMGLILLPEDA